MCSSRLSVKKIRVIRKAGVSDTEIAFLHRDLAPLFAHVIQDVRPRAESRFPSVNGGYSVLFQERTDLTAMRNVIEGHGFSIDPASTTTPSAATAQAC